MSNTTCDVGIIGLGAIGSATLMHLAKSGATVVGVDQYSPPHCFGSSHGETRITRLSVGEGEAYIPLVRRAHELWRAIEVEAHAQILTITGGLLLDDGTGASVHGVEGFTKRTVQLAERFGIPHEVLTAKDVRARFPEFNVEHAGTAYYEPSAGFVRPEAAIEAQLKIAKENGAELRLNEHVTEIRTSSAGTVQIHTGTGVIEAAQCLIAAGAWIKNFLPEAAKRFFKIRRQVLHWVPIEKGAYPLKSSPIFIWCYGGTDEDWVYGFPSLDGQTIKVASESVVESSSPESIDRTVSTAEQKELIETKIASRLKGITGMPIKSATCLYTVTPGSQFIVETHPDIPNALIASCCSGHGFKHSAALGESIAETLLGKSPTLDLGAFQTGAFGSATLRG